MRGAQISIVPCLLVSSAICGAACVHIPSASHSQARPGPVLHNSPIHSLLSPSQAQTGFSPRSSFFTLSFALTLTLCSPSLPLL